MKILNNELQKTYQIHFLFITKHKKQEQLTNIPLSPIFGNICMTLVLLTHILF